MPPPTVPPAPTKKKPKKSHKAIKELRPDRIAMERKRRKLNNHAVSSSVSSPSISTVPPTTTVTPPPPAMTMITPTHSARRSKTAPDQFTNRVQSIQKSQGVRLDDTKILVSLRKRFVDAIKLAKKNPLDSKGLKKIANSNFSLVSTLVSLVKRFQTLLQREHRHRRIPERNSYLRLKHLWSGGPENVLPLE
jgi:hypothetical protein